MFCHSVWVQLCQKIVTGFYHSILPHLWQLLHHRHDRERSTQPCFGCPSHAFDSDKRNNNGAKKSWHNYVPIFVAATQMVVTNQFVIKRQVDRVCWYFLSVCDGAWGWKNMCLFFIAHVIGSFFKSLLIWPVKTLLFKCHWQMKCSEKDSLKSVSKTDRKTCWQSPVLDNPFGIFIVLPMSLTWWDCPAFQAPVF